MNEDFFGNGDQPEIEKIQLGEDEFTQDELQELVGLGKVAKEIESEQKIKLNRVWPQFRTVQNNYKNLEDKYKLLEQNQELRKQVPSATPSQPKDPSQLTPDELKQEALKQLENLGVGPQAIALQVQQIIDSRRLVDDIQSTIDEAMGDGLPEATIQDVVSHMQETGIKNPVKAYRDLFEKEYREQQLQKLQQVKKTGLPTISQSQAGMTRQPAPTKITDGNLEDSLNGFFGGN